MTTTTAATEATAPRVCACNCGAAVAKKSRFRMGHDQRLVSQLAAELVDNHGVLADQTLALLNIDDWDHQGDIEGQITTVVYYVSMTFSAGLANKVDNAARRRWEKTGKGKPAKVAEPVKDTAANLVSDVMNTLTGNGDKAATLGECGGTTKAGKKCKRRAETGTEFCHAHRKAAQ